MLDKIKFYWEYIQSLCDIDGDLWMGLLTGVFILRIALVLKHYSPITSAEAALYSAAIGAFAYSNKGPKGS